MGLDILCSDCDSAQRYHGSYGSFHYLRINVTKVCGYGHAFNDNDQTVDLSLLPEPLAGLMCHSDCGGELSSEECAALVPYVRRAIEEFDRGTAVSDEPEIDASNARQLLGLLEHCTEARHVATFG